MWSNWKLWKCDLGNSNTKSLRRLIKEIAKNEEEVYLEIMD